MDASWLETILSGLIGGAVAAVVGLLGFKHEINKLQVERSLERERSFEKAQGGYRACYRKFIVNVSDGANVDVLLDNFWEAIFCGDPIVIEELESYWSAEARGERMRPEGPPPDALLRAMRDHGSRTLLEHIELKERFEGQEA